MELSRVLRRTAGCLLAVSLGLFGPLAGIPTVRAVEKLSIFVDTSSDLPLEQTNCTPNPLDVKCTTLRAALIYVNTQGLKDYQVVFAEALQDQVITLDGRQGSLMLTTSCLGSEYCLLDGGTRNVRIDGSDLDPGVPTLQVGGSHNTIRGLGFINGKSDGIQIGTGTGSCPGQLDLDRGQPLPGERRRRGVRWRRRQRDHHPEFVIRIGPGPLPGGCLPGQANGTGIQVSGPVNQVSIEMNTIACSGRTASPSWPDRHRSGRRSSLETGSDWTRGRRPAAMGAPASTTRET